MNADKALLKIEIDTESYRNSMEKIMEMTTALQEMCDLLGKIYGLRDKIFRPMFVVENGYGAQGGIVSEETINEIVKRCKNRIL